MEKLPIVIGITASKAPTRVKKRSIWLHQPMRDAILALCPPGTVTTSKAIAVALGKSENTVAPALWSLVRDRLVVCRKIKGQAALEWTFRDVDPADLQDRRSLW